MLLVLGDHKPPSHGIRSHTESWTGSISQPAKRNTKLLRLPWLNLISVSSSLESWTRNLARDLCMLTLCTEYPAPRGLTSHFESSDTRIKGCRNNAQVLSHLQELWLVDNTHLSSAHRRPCRSGRGGSGSCKFLALVSHL